MEAGGVTGAVVHRSTSSDGDGTRRSDTDWGSPGPRIGEPTHLTCLNGQGLAHHVARASRLSRRMTEDGCAAVSLARVLLANSRTRKLGTSESHVRGDRARNSEAWHVRPLQSGFPSNEPHRDATQTQGKTLEDLPLGVSKLRKR